MALMQKAKSTEGVQPIGNCGVSPKSKPSVLPAVMSFAAGRGMAFGVSFRPAVRKAAETFLHNRWMEGESQMDKPVIGVLPGTNGDGSGFFMVPAYARSIEASGGIPVMLPLTADEAVLRQLAALCAGFLLPGGQDISPMVYDEPVSEGWRPAVPRAGSDGAAFAARACSTGTSRCSVSAAASSFSMRRWAVRCIRICRPNVPPAYRTARRSRPMRRAIR